MSREELIKEFGILARGTTLPSIGSVFQKVSAFVILALQVRYLGIEPYGAFVISFGIVMLASTLQTCGMLPTGIRFIVKARIDKNISQLWASYWCIWLLPVFMGVIIGFILYLLAPILNEALYHSTEFEQSMRIFAIALPLLGAAEIPAVMTRAFETNRYYVISKNILGQGFEIVLLLMLFFLMPIITDSHKVVAVALTRVAGYALQMIAGHWGFLMLCKARNMNLGFNPANHIRAILEQIHNLKHIVLYCLPVLVSATSNRIMQWVDTVIVGSLLNVASAGVYRIAVQISIALNAVLYSVGSILSPMVARYHHQSQMQMIDKVYTQATRIIVLGILPFATAIIVFPEAFLSLFSPEAVIASTALVIMVAGQLFNSFTGNVGIILVMTDKAKWHALNGVVAMIIEILLCLFFVSYLGMMGAAIAVASTVVLLNIMRVLETRRFFHIKCFSERIIQPVIPGIIGLGCLALLSYFLGRDFITSNFIFTTLIAVSISCAMIWGLHILFFISEEDKQFLNSIFSAVASKFKAGQTG